MRSDVRVRRFPGREDGRPLMRCRSELPAVRLCGCAAVRLCGCAAVLSGVCARLVQQLLPNFDHLQIGAARE